MGQPHKQKEIKKCCSTTTTTMSSSSSSLLLLLLASAAATRPNPLPPECLPLSPAPSVGVALEEGFLTLEGLGKEKTGVFFLNKKKITAVKRREIQRNSKKRSCSAKRNATFLFLQL